MVKHQDAFFCIACYMETVRIGSMPCFGEQWACQNTMKGLLLTCFGGFREGEKLAKLFGDVQCLQ